MASGVKQQNCGGEGGGRKTSEEEFEDQLMKAELLSMEAFHLEQFKRENALKNTASPTFHRSAGPSPQPACTSPIPPRPASAAAQPSASALSRPSSTTRLTSSASSSSLKSEGITSTSVNARDRPKGSLKLPGPLRPPPPQVKSVAGQGASSNFGDLLTLSPTKEVPREDMDWMGELDRVFKSSADKPPESALTGAAKSPVGAVMSEANMSKSQSFPELGQLNSKPTQQYPNYQLNLYPQLPIPSPVQSQQLMPSQFGMMPQPPPIGWNIYPANTSMPPQGMPMPGSMMGQSQSYYGGFPQSSQPMQMGHRPSQMPTLQQLNPSPQFSSFPAQPTPPGSPMRQGTQTQPGVLPPPVPGRQVEPPKTLLPHAPGQVQPPPIPDKGPVGSFPPGRGKDGTEGSKVGPPKAIEDGAKGGGSLDVLDFFRHRRKNSDLIDWLDSGPKKQHTESILLDANAAIDIFDPLFEKGLEEELVALPKSPTAVASDATAAPSPAPDARPPRGAGREGAVSPIPVSEPRLLVPREKLPPSPRLPQRTGSQVAARPQKKVERVADKGRRKTVGVYPSLLEVKDAEMADSSQGMYLSGELRHLGHQVARLLETSEPADGFVYCKRLHRSLSDQLTVKVKVEGDFLSEPIVFTPCVTDLVSSLIEHVLTTIQGGSKDAAATDRFFMRAFGRAEYLISCEQLGVFQYVTDSMRLGEDVRLVIEQKDSVTPPFVNKLTSIDREDLDQMLLSSRHDVSGKLLSREKIQIVMKTLTSEIEKLREISVQSGVERLPSTGVVQASKALCSIMQGFETTALGRAVGKLQNATLSAPRTRRIKKRVSKHTPLHELTEEDTHAFTERNMSPLQLTDKDRLSMVAEIQDQLQNVESAAAEQIRLFCQAHRIPGAVQLPRRDRERKELTIFSDNVMVEISAIHGVSHVLTQHPSGVFKVTCQLCHGVKCLGQVETALKPASRGLVSDHVLVQDWMPINNTSLAASARETCLLFQVFMMTSGGHGDDGKGKTKRLGWISLPLFDHRGLLQQGPQLLPLWKTPEVRPWGTSLPAGDGSSSVSLSIVLQDFGCDIFYPEIGAAEEIERLPFTDLHQHNQEQLQEILERDWLLGTPDEELSRVWELKEFLTRLPAALPWCLLAVPAWDAQTEAQVRTLLDTWAPPDTAEAMRLLLPKFPAGCVRAKAVKWLDEKLSNDEVCELMPQLVQCLKFEPLVWNNLTELLLNRAIQDIRVAHVLFWHLREAQCDVVSAERLRMVCSCLLSVCPADLRAELQREELLVAAVTAVAKKVKASKDRSNVLLQELGPIHEDLFKDGPMRMPYDIGFQMSGLHLSLCSYFSSNAFPLKLVFRNPEERAGGVYAMFKVGDDLRQDQLTLQLIGAMDRMWLKAGLDLKMLTFTCMATGHNEGFVELITESETLRKIQQTHGVTGAFKERPIAEWLQKQNPTQLFYQQAVQNFSQSCAGYCVGTRVLGVCDRHNDNIMLKKQGHMFHIDFGKFLGDSQMFGNFKRDRVPFVLTSDMAYVINGSSKSTERFQEFVDQASEAFNIVRRNRQHFITLLALMSYAGIAGVGKGALRFVDKALLPGHSENEAAMIFTRMIEESLKSFFTKLNFVLHNFAQLKFGSHTPGTLLSFMPKTYSVSTDGRIKAVQVVDFEKRYQPEKHYVYKIRVERKDEKVASFVFRRYSEFWELYSKLLCDFPLAHLPVLPPKTVLGRSHIRNVAEKRAADLERFLRELLTLAAEIAECDLVYTFFHPMLRDEQATGAEEARNIEPPRVKSGVIRGQIKLSLHFKQGTFSVMIMHAKDLAAVPSGELPDPYVKLYLLPDPCKETKKKTKILHRQANPSFMELLQYRVIKEELQKRTLQVTIWSYDILSENHFLGAVYIPLAGRDLEQQLQDWFPLGSLQYLPGQGSLA